MSNPKAREEEYLRRRRERGYIPSLAGMDDEDIEWALERMDRRQEEPEEYQLGKTFRPPDRDFAERMFNMFKRPFDPNWQMPNLDGPEFRQPDKPRVANSWSYGQSGNDTGATMKRMSTPVSNPYAGGYSGGGAEGDMLFDVTGVKPLDVLKNADNSKRVANPGLGTTNTAIDRSQGEGETRSSHYIVYSREDQRFYWVDGNNGAVIKSWAGGHNFVPGVNENGESRASLPVGSYDVSAELTGGKYGPAYGTFYITTGDPRYRDIHGGGTGLGDPYAPRHELLPTYGCLRMQNTDGEDLSREIIKQGNKVRLVVVDGPAMFSESDQR